MILLFIDGRRCFMQSRMDKYQTKDNKKFERSRKNTKLYEEVYDEIPTMKVSVYGIPKSLFKDKFGKTFGSKEFLNYKDTLKKNNYKSCDLLCTKDINQTGVYYIDYTQLNKKGDYINYIIDYHFENIGEKVYLLTEKSGGYNITNNELFNQWKTEHAEQLINN